MIEPAIYNNFKVVAGDDWDLSLNWKNDDGTLIDLHTGWHAVLSFFLSRKDRTLVKQLTDGAGITLAATSPNIKAVIAKTQTTFDQPPGYLILELTQPDTTEFRLVEGKIVYLP